VPFCVAIRAQSEGMGAWLKKPASVMFGQTVFFITIIIAGFVLLFLGAPGYLIGAIGLTLGSLASSWTMRISLNWVKEKPIPVGQTTTSVGQIR
jgi:uncharacterized membrane protein